MQYKIKPFEELDIIDDYLVNVQKAIVGVAPLRRGIRLDLEILEFEEDTDLVTKNIYDIEPNKRKDIDIIKHNRFYQAKIDSRNLQAGETDFVRLPNLFVMMITNYDPFGYDYMLYTVHNKCNEVPEMAYKDGLQFLYFNTTGTKGGNESLKKLLAYIQDSKEYNVTDEATRKLHDCVSIVKVSPEARDEYMLLEEKLFYEKRDAKEEGREDERIRVIRAKLAKGKSVEEIADSLELDDEVVRKLVNDIQGME